MTRGQRTAVPGGWPGGVLVNTMEYQLILGRKIAQERRRHGLSQPELAALLGRPVGWVSQVERGVQPLDGPAALQTVADALELSRMELVTWLPPQLPSPAPSAGSSSPNGSAAANVATPRHEATAPTPAATLRGVVGQPLAGGSRPRPPGAAGLTVILAGAHSLVAMLGDQSAPPLDWLRAQTDRACTLARADQLSDLTSVLGDLLPGLEAAVRATTDVEQGDCYELMAVAYQACAAALARQGETEAAWLAADRAMAAAERAGNLLLVAAGAHRLASVFLSARRDAMADETARTTIAALQGLAGLGDPDATALCGALSLLRAVVAARSGHQGAAYGQLAQARQLATALGRLRTSAAPEFSAQCVALYEVAVSVDFGDSGHALRVAAAVDTTELSPVRQARLLIDIARAFALRGQRDNAVAALLRAEAVSADSVARSERVRKVLADLLTRHDPPSAALADLAARLALRPGSG